MCAPDRLCSVVPCIGSSRRSNNPGSIRTSPEVCLPVLLLRLRGGAMIEIRARSTSTTTRRRQSIPAVADAMDGALREDFGNASSVHGWGQRAKARLDDARAAVAALVGGDPTEVVFTGSGTEADVLAVRGAAEALEAVGPAAPRDQHHRARGGAADRAGARPPRLGGHAGSASIASGVVAPDALRRPGHRRHRAGLGDARQQRGRHHPADRRARRHRPRARRAVPHRRRAGGRQAAARRRGARRRPAGHLRPQVLRPEGHRRAVGAPRHAAASRR